MLSILIDECKDTPFPLKKEKIFCFCKNFAYQPYIFAFEKRQEILTY